MKLEIIDHGVMLPDYFSGTAGVMLPLTIDNQTTIGEIIDQLESEINMVWNHIEYTAEYNGFSGNLDLAIETELQSIKDYNQGELSRIYNPDLDFCFDDDPDLDDCREYPILILTIEFMED